MEDVMANMSLPSSSTCAGVIAGQGETLTKVGLFGPLLQGLPRLSLTTVGFMDAWKHASPFLHLHRKMQLLPLKERLLRSERSDQ